MLDTSILETTKNHIKEFRGGKSYRVSVTKLFNVYVHLFVIILNKNPVREKNFVKCDTLLELLLFFTGNDLYLFVQFFQFFITNMR